MLRIHQSKSAGAAQEYFDDGLVREDYYVPDRQKDSPEEEPARWGGAGARALGLTGNVERAAFRNLCDNLTPDGERSLTARTKANRRVGYDVSFHCPKGVSVLHAMTGDRAIMEAFRAAVTESMQELEATTETRVRAKGENSTRTTGNLIWAEFIHTTTRPVGGFPDPHLHAHCYTFNATFDPVEQRWKAAELGQLVQGAGLHEAGFHTRLATRLAEAGYAVERQGRFWGVAGLPETLLAKYSRRTAEIDAFAERKGITDPKEKAELGARTRKSKSKAASWPEVEREWHSRLGPEEHQALAEAKQRPQKDEPAMTADAVLQAAAEKCLERSARVPEGKVLEEALRQGVGRFRPEELRAALAQHPAARSTVGGQTYLSDSAARQQENELVDFARAGRGTCPPLAPSTAPVAPDILRPSHREALERVAASIDRVTLLPKVGSKERAALLGALEERISRTGQSVMRLSALGLEGLASGAATFLSGTARSALASGVALVEHAHRLGLHQLTNLFQAAKDSRARLVLETTTPNRRHMTKDKPGSLLEHLASRAGLRSLESSSTAKRREDLRASLREINAGKSNQAIERLTRLGAIKEATQDTLASVVAIEYASAAARGKRSLPLVIAVGDSKKLSDAIRRQLKERKLLGRERGCEQLTRVWIPEDTKDPVGFFRRGQVVQFWKSAKGFKAGQRYKVIGKDPFGNVIARKGAFFEALPLSKLQHFGLYERSTTKLARGDVVRITASGRTKNERFGVEKLLPKRQQAIRIENLKRFGPKAPDRRYRVNSDTFHRIAGFTLGGDIKLDNGWVLPRSYGHLERTHCRNLMPEGSTQGRAVWLVDSGKHHWSTILHSKSLMPAGSMRIFTADKAALQKNLKRMSEPDPAQKKSRPAAPPRFIDMTRRTPQHDKQDRGLERER